MARVLENNDSGFSSNLTSRALWAAGHAVVEEGDGEPNRETLSGHSPDCVALDFLMPAMNRPGFLSHIERPRVLVVDVDDDASNRLIPLEALSFRGTCPLAIDVGTSALEALQTGPPSRVAAEAHGVKAASLTIGANDLAKDCRRLGEAVRNVRLSAARGALQTVLDELPMMTAVLGAISGENG